MSPELAAQEEASRLSRAHLAFRRCVCGRCAEGSVEECELCARYQPRCLTRPVEDHEGGAWRVCAGGEGCSGTKREEA